MVAAEIPTEGTNTGLTVTTTAEETAGVVGAHIALLTISTVMELGVPNPVPVVL